MNAKPRRLWAVAVSILGVACATAEVPPADLEPWDQERVTALATELATAAKAVRDAYRLQAASPAASTPRNVMVYQDILKKLALSTGQLSARLAAGEGREATLPVARKIRTQVRDAQVEGRRILQTDQMTSRIDPAKDLFDQLGPYYFGRVG